MPSHHRFDGNHALQVAHFADAAVLGERVADDKQVFVDRLIRGDDRECDRGSLLAVAINERFQRVQKLRGRIDLGLNHNRPQAGMIR